MKASCWACKRPLDDQFPAGDYDNNPVEGDCSVCIYCGALSTFTFVKQELTMRKPTTEELHTFLTDVDIQQALELWRSQWKPEWANRDSV